MIKVLDGQDYPDAASFVTDLNKARLANRKAWLFYRGMVGGHSVDLKTFDIGDLQIVKVDGRDVRRNEYGMNVSQWRAEIEDVIDGAIKRLAA